MPIPRLRRSTRPRSRDDDDWGTSSPAAIMNSLPPPSAASASASASVPSSSAAARGPRAEIGIDSANTMTNDSGTSSAHADGSRGSRSKGSKGLASSSSPSASAMGDRSAGSPEQRSLAAAFAKLQQQDLKAYTCTFSPRCVISLYFAIAIIFLPLGIMISAGTANLRFHGPIEYGHESSSTSLTVQLTGLNRTIRSPSYFYYVLENYHQNSREYVKSRSDTMNQGIVPTAKVQIENCDRWLCHPDGGDSCLRDAEGNLNIDEYVFPCGLTARSFFNDTFKLKKRVPSSSGSGSTLQDVDVNSGDDIAWWTDRKYKFNAGEDAVFNKSFFPDGKTANDLLEDPHFVVWMRLSAFPKFYKLYGIINENLEAGQEYTVEIDNFYPVNSFGGKKYFFITELAWFGDSNAFLGTMYLIVGVIALFLAVFLLTKHMSNPSGSSHMDHVLLLREHLAKFESDASTPVNPSTTTTAQPLHLN